MNTEPVFRFIIVDDHPFFRDGVIRHLLTYPQFRLIGEYTQTRALLSDTHIDEPDFILLDLNLPGIEGRQSCTLLKQKFPKARIIALTQYQGIQDLLKQYPFDGYVDKQRSEQLVEAIETVLSGKPFFSQPAQGTELTLKMQHDPYLQSIGFSGREWEIIGLIIQGLTNKEIAGKLFISEFTVKTHRKNIYQKADVGNVAGLIQFAQKTGITTGGNDPI